MFTQEVNVDAMYRATELMFGEQAPMILAKLADVIDKAMVDGYEQGLMDGREKFEEATAEAFDNGFAEGAVSTMFAGEAELSSEAYDDGYLDGVQNARGNPALADALVQDIISDRAEEHFEALDEYDADYEESLSGFMLGEPRQ